MPAIRRLVDRAEQLGQKLQGQTHKFVLCHSDIHGGNVLIEGNDSIYIVDWDDPIKAPKERDLMFIGGVLQMFGISRMKESFFIGAMEKLKLTRPSWPITGMNESWRKLPSTVMLCC